MVPEKAKEREKQINRLQQNLSTIRRIAGWTTEQMGEKIGVTKQTISNLENGKTPMNFTQYIAIRAILDCEIEANTSNEVLPKAVDILLDSNEEEYMKYREPLTIVAASAAGGIASAALLGIFSTLIPVAGLGIAGGIVAASWLKNILKK